MENVQNKTAIITGAGSGIGYSIAEELLRNDAKQIVIIDLPIIRSHKAVKKLREEFGKERVIFFDCNITQPEYEEIFKKAVNALGKLDILVNNAGIANDYNIEGTFAINTVALIRGSLYGLNYMSKQKNGNGGTIINIASIAGLKYSSYLPVYSASKFAVVAFSQALKDYYNTTNVRVLLMCPYLTKTPITDNVQFLDFVSEKWQDILTNRDSQSATHVGCAVIELIQKGENGAIWSIKNGERPSVHQMQPTIERTM